MPKNKVRTPASYKLLLAGATAVLAILVSLVPGQPHEALVIKVFDGDTVQIASGEKVRLIGIDCPELHESEKLSNDAKRTGQDIATIKAMGEQAYIFTERWVLGQKVRLVFDRQKKDKYGRLLAYVYLPFPRPALLNSPRAGYIVNLDGKKWYFLNATIVQSGYAVPMTIPPNDRHAIIIKALYDQAREYNRGLWTGEKVKRTDRKQRSGRTSAKELETSASAH